MLYVISKCYIIYRNAIYYIEMLYIISTCYILCGYAICYIYVLYIISKCYILYRNTIHYIEMLYIISKCYLLFAKCMILALVWVFIFLFLLFNIYNSILTHLAPHSCKPTKQHNEEYITLATCIFIYIYIYIYIKKIILAWFCNFMLRINESVFAAC